MTDKTPPPDIPGLLARIRAGDVSASQELVVRFDTGLRAILRQRVRPDLFDDVYQETWARTYQKIMDGFVPDNLAAWFLGVARFVMLEFIRKEHVHTSLDPELEAMIAAALPDLDHAMYTEQQRRRLIECMRKLPERYSEFLIGHAARKDKSELCASISLAESNYRKFLYRARNELKKCMRPSFPEAF